MLSFLGPLVLLGVPAFAAVVSAVVTLLAARFAPAFVWYVAIGSPFLIVYSIFWAGESSGWEAFQLVGSLLLYLAGTAGSLAAMQLYRALSRAFQELSPDDVNR